MRVYVQGLFTLELAAKHEQLLTYMLSIQFHSWHSLTIVTDKSGLRVTLHYHRVIETQDNLEN